MKKTILFMVILCILAVSVSAFSLNWFTSWFTAEPAVLENIKVYPEKVRPGDVLLVTAQVSGDIDTIVAHIYHEEGFDEVSMVTIGSVGDKRTYEARWIVHDTLNEKWYDVDVIVDGNIVMSTQFLDPEQGHDWAQIRNKPTIPTVPSDVCTASNGKCGGDVPQGILCGVYSLTPTASRWSTVIACKGVTSSSEPVCPSGYQLTLFVEARLRDGTYVQYYTCNKL